MIILLFGFTAASKHQCTVYASRDPLKYHRMYMSIAFVSRLHHVHSKQPTYDSLAPNAIFVASSIVDDDAYAL